MSNNRAIWNYNLQLLCLLLYCFLSFHTLLLTEIKTVTKSVLELWNKSCDTFFSREGLLEKSELIEGNKEGVLSDIYSPNQYPIEYWLEPISQQVTVTPLSSDFKS